MKDSANAEVTGLNSVAVLKFLKASFCNCVNCADNYDDHVFISGVWVYACNSTRQNCGVWNLPLSSVFQNFYFVLLLSCISSLLKHIGVKHQLRFARIEINRMLCQVGKGPELWKQSWANLHCFSNWNLHDNHASQSKEAEIIVFWVTCIENEHYQAE